MSEVEAAACHRREIKHSIQCSFSHVLLTESEGHPGLQAAESRLVWSEPHCGHSSLSFLSDVRQEVFLIADQVPKRHRAAGTTASLALSELSPPPRKKLTPELLFPCAPWNAPEKAAGLRAPPQGRLSESEERVF